MHRGDAEEDQVSDAPRERPRRRWGCWCCSVPLGLILALLVVYVIAWNRSAARLAAEMQRLQKAGEHLKLSELVPTVGEDEDNAAVVYEQAFNIQPGDFGDYTGGAPQWTAAQAAAARALVADNADYFGTLEEASRIPKCVFGKGWDAGPNIMFPEYAKFREAARGLEVRAEVQRTSGRLDDAARSCLTSLRIANHAEEAPTFIGYLVGIAVQGITTKELQRVFSSGDPSPAICRGLYDQLGTRTGLEAYTAAMKGERAFGLAAFDMVEKRGSVAAAGIEGDQARARWLWALYPLVGKPLWNQDKLYYLQFAQRNIEAIAKPYGEALKDMDDAQQAVAALPPYSSLMTRMVSPVVSRSLWSAYRAIAYARAAQIAAAAKAYKGTHGRYPASLKELAGDGWRLPLDPFTNKPYFYHREGAGIAVWSVGPDMVDNRGVDWDPQNRRQANDTGYDCVFRSAR
jgi:hypothetical protein